MTKKIPAEEKLNRKPISRACVFCHEKHLQCDIGRPCQNCVKRNIDSSCRDNIRKPRKKRAKFGHTSNLGSKNKRVATGTVQRARAAKLEKLGADKSPLDGADVIKKEETNGESLVQDSNSQCSVGPNVGAGMVGLEKERGEAEGLCKIPSLTALFTSEVDPIIHDDALLPEAFTIGNRNLGTEMGGEMPTSGLENSNPGISAFGSTWASNEYMKLNEILGTPYTDELGALNSTEEEMGSKIEDSTVNPSAFPKTASMMELTADAEQFPRVSSRMHISLDMAYLTSSYQNSDGTTIPPTSENDSNSPKFDLMSPYALRQLIKTPEDLYKYQESIVPHNYREAYQDLLALLRDRFLDSSTEAVKTGWKKLQTIAQSIKIHYAPIFVTLTSNLIEGDLRMQEFILQRTLLEYEGMSKMVNCIPMCIWRRSGELCYASNEFISLTGYSRKEVLSKRRFIMEYFDNDSIVEYFKVFNEYLAFSSKKGIAATSDGQAIFSDCNLLLSSGLFLKCACIWTVKRDSFNIPMLIMGQFLPVLDDHYT